ncbi:hypothetical protein [Virgibacillus ainsalahensis]
MRNEQGEDVLEWWFSKEDDMIDEIDRLLSSFIIIKSKKQNKTD